MDETPSPESVSEISPLVAQLSAPIQAAVPVGDDPKYSVEFEFVKSEISKTSGRDWEQIVVASRKVLTSQAKDVTLLCYHLLASTVARGWKEGADAARTMAILLGAHWDTIHPLRERARENSFKWLVEERTVGTFAQVAHEPSDHAALLEFSKALSEIKDIVDSKFAEGAPSMKPLSQLVDEKIKATKPVVAAPRPVAPVAPVATPAAPASSEPRTEAPMVADGASKGDLLMVLQKVALQCSASDPASSLGFKLLRICRWQELAALPKNDDGRTSIAPPNPARVSFLEGQIGQKAWRAVLEKSEGIFTEPGLHFWLDLQRWVVEAHQGMGQESCAEAVRSELRGLLKRLPGLVDLKFSDGTPFASVQTRDWLDKLAREGSGAPAQSAAQREDTLETDLVTARELAGSGQVADALELLQAGLIYGDLRSRTLRQLEIARTALLGGKIRSALSVSAEIAERSGRMNLGAWEPVLEGEILEIHLRSLNAAIEAGIGEPDALKASREALASRAGITSPALLARFEF